MASEHNRFTAGQERPFWCSRRRRDADARFVCHLRLSVRLRDHWVASIIPLLGGTNYWFQGRSDTGEVVIAMAHSVILKNELAGKWSIGVE